MGDDFVHCCLQRSYPGLLRYQKFEGINESALNILNQDWKNKPYIRISCSHLLSGSILEEGNEALLINCDRSYNRKPSLHPHCERFGSRYMAPSGPSMNSKHNNINIISKIEDKSKKLIIGILVSSALVISSIRSIELANKDQKLETANSHDCDSQLRQARSRFTSPRTYTSSRFSGPWTDQTYCRPYTIFSLLDKNQTDPFNDFIVASSILVNVADSM